VGEAPSGVWRAAGNSADLDLSNRSTGNSPLLLLSLQVLYSLCFANMARVWSVQDDLPHIDDCGVCMRCVVDTPPKPLGMRIEELKEEHFMPVDVREKQLKPVCEACRGCTHELTLLVSPCCS
jgi:hypothetical protein